jgi:hypothetical protein
MSPDRIPPLIPLFGQNVRHSSVPAKSCSVIARGGGQGWLQSRPDSASPLTAASTMAGLRPLGTGDVHRCDPGSIDAVGAHSACQAGLVDYAPAKRFDRPSLRDIRHRGVEALQSAATLDTRRHARRKRRRTASSIEKGAHCD